MRRCLELGTAPHVVITHAEAQQHANSKQEADRLSLS